MRHGKRRIFLPDLLLGILNDRQVSQAQEVHFKEPQLLNGGHGILGDHRIIVFRQGHIAAHRLRRDHHTGGMGGGVAGHALQAHGNIHQLVHPLIPIVKLPEFGGFFQGGF